MKFLINTILLILIFCTNSGFSGTQNGSLLNKKEIQYNLKKDFTGIWVNTGNERKAIIKCKIVYKDNKYVVQMWGACKPQECDWGEKTTNEVKKGIIKFELLWDTEFSESNITYEIIDDKLKMTHNRQFKDVSGRPNYSIIEYFSKQ